MFDIGWGELLVVGVIALIVIGPKELPTVLRTLGQYLGKVKRMANEFQGQFQDALREAELTDLKKEAEELTGSLTDQVKEFTEFDPMADTRKEIESSFEGEGEGAHATQDAEPASDEAAKSEPAPSELPASEPAADQAQPAAVAEAVAEKPAVEIPLPEPAAPVSSEEFAPAKTPPKPAGDAA